MPATHTAMESRDYRWLVLWYLIMIVEAFAVAITLEDFNTIASLTAGGMCLVFLIGPAFDCDEESSENGARIALTGARWMLYLAFGSAMLALLHLGYEAHALAQ